MSDHTIGQLAAAAGVSVETVRYYHRRGLLPAPARAHGSIRRYGPSALTRLRFIRRAQALGFTLDEVEALLSLEDGQTCAQARAIGEQRLADVRIRIRDLQALAKALRGLLARCASLGEAVKCPLIESLLGPEAAGAAAPRGKPPSGC